MGNCERSTGADLTAGSSRNVLDYLLSSPSKWFVCAQPQTNYLRAYAILMPTFVHT